MMLRLRRCRGVRHTKTVKIIPSGYVAHRSKQDICVPQMSVSASPDRLKS